MMSAPIFFSVASGDVALAEKIFARFRGGDIYLYSKSGENGAWIWKEIEEDQLPFAKAVVVFWSAHFVGSEYTVRELRLARKLFDEGRLQDCVIIRIDDTPLIANAGESLPSLHAEAIDLLSAFLGHKRSDPLKNVEAEAQKLVSTLRDRVFGERYPFQRRSVVQDQIEDAIDRDAATRYPVLWLSGFNGYGRKTLARELFRGLDRTVHEVEVLIDETSLPEQILMRIDSQYSGLMRAELAEMATNARNASPQDVAEAIERLAANKGYLMLQQSRLYEESVRLPEWVDETIAALTPGPLPKLVLVTQLPPTDEQKLGLVENLAACSVPAMTPTEATDFAWKIIRSAGGRNAWWNDEIVDRIVTATGGNPDLIIAVTQQAFRLDRPEMIDDILGKQVQRFSETLTNVISFAMKQIEYDDVYKRILLFLDYINPVDREAIERFLGIEKSVSPQLTRLMDLSLVERSDAGLFRINPLVSNRLQGFLIDPQIVASHREAMQEFANAGLEIDGDELGFFKIEAKIQAELLSGKAELSEDVAVFASVAHFLSVGVRLYNASRWQDAEPLLKKAFDQRKQFSLTTQIESGRFYGLVCIKSSNKTEFDRVVNAMRLAAQSRSLADYLQGEWLRVVDRDWREAARYFNKAWVDAKEKRDKTREEKILSPYIDCILSSPHPNLDLAKQLADRAASINKTRFSLWRKAQVYLEVWKTNIDSNKLELDYYDCTDDLRDFPGGEAFYQQMMAMEHEVFGRWEDAVACMNLANPSDKIDVSLQKWGMMVRSGLNPLISEAKDQIRSICASKTKQHAKMAHAEALADIYAKALRHTGDLKKFKLTALGLPLSEEQIDRIYRAALNTSRRGRTA